MKTKYLLVMGLGVWTAIASFWVIIPAVTALGDEAVFEVAITLLILAGLLTLGGTRLAWDAMRRFKSVG
jgi:hypothetical protein